MADTFEELVRINKVDLTKFKEVNTSSDEWYKAHKYHSGIETISYCDEDGNVYAFVKED